MDEQERRAACRKIAEDMQAAGLGWNEDAILRLTRAPIGIPEMIQAFDRFAQSRPRSGSPRRAKRRAAKRRRK